MWPFTKRDDNNWKQLHKNLSTSFSNIKIDINKITEYLKHHDKKHDYHHTNIDQLSKRIDKLEYTIETLLKIQNKEFQKPTQQILSLKQSPIFENLTSLQKSLITNIAILLKENSQDWLSLKYLAQELYPTKNHHNIKSTLSTYTDSLLELGLLTKKKKGRQVYVALTDKARKQLPKQDIRTKTKAQRQSI